MTRRLACVGVLLLVGCGSPTPQPGGDLVLDGTGGASAGTGAPGLNSACSDIDLPFECDSTRRVLLRCWPTYEGARWLPVQTCMPDEYCDGSARLCIPDLDAAGGGDGSGSGDGGPARDAGAGTDGDAGGGTGTGPDGGGCCRVCSDGKKPCGDLCIGASAACHRPPGCACPE